MRTHVRVIAWLHIGFGILMLLAFLGTGVAFIAMGQMMQHDLSPATSSTVSRSNDAQFDAFPFALIDFRAKP